MLTRCRSISSQGRLCYNAIAENHKENFNSLYLGMRILLSFLFSMIRSSKTNHFLQSRGICTLHFGTVQLRTRMDLCGMHTNCKFNPPKTITNRIRIEKLGFVFFFKMLKKKWSLYTLNKSGYIDIQKQQVIPALLALAVAAIEVLPHELLVFGYLHSGKKHPRRRNI